MLIVSDNCRECDELEIEFMKITVYINGINYQVINKDHQFGLALLLGFEILITPALIINGQLVTYGNPGNKKLENVLLKHI